MGDLIVLDEAHRYFDVRSARRVGKTFGALCEAFRLNFPTLPRTSTVVWCQFNTWYTMLTPELLSEDVLCLKVAEELRKYGLTAEESVKAAKRFIRKVKGR